MVREIIEIARFAPSGGNLQPWMVHVLSGESLARFRAMMAPKVQAAPLGNTPEYNVYPPNVKEPYRSRRFKVGEDMYGQIGVKREDKAARIRQFARNHDFFGAPVAMFFCLDRSLGPPQWSDLGMFIQTIMLLARERGLETCPQESWAGWHQGNGFPRGGAGTDAVLRAGTRLWRLRGTDQSVARRSRRARGIRVVS